MIGALAGACCAGARGLEAPRTRRRGWRLSPASGEFEATGATVGGGESEGSDELVSMTIGFGGPGLGSTSPHCNSEGAGTVLAAEASNRGTRADGAAGSSTYRDRQSTNALALDEMWNIS